MPEVRASATGLLEVRVSWVGALRPVCGHGPDDLAERSCQHSCPHQQHRHPADVLPTLLRIVHDARQELHHNTRMYILYARIMRSQLGKRRGLESLRAAWLLPSTAAAAAGASPSLARSLGKAKPESRTKESLSRHRYIESCSETRPMQQQQQQQSERHDRK